jgi:hypothetical protein
MVYTNIYAVAFDWNFLFVVLIPETLQISHIDSNSPVSRDSIIWTDMEKSIL